MASLAVGSLVRITSLLVFVLFLGMFLSFFIPFDKRGYAVYI